MRRFMTLLVAVAAASLSVGGCSSDSDNSGGSAGSSNGQCLGDYAAVTQSELGAKVASKAGCAADVAAICGNDVTTTTEECGADCYMNMAADDATQDKCVSSCVLGSIALSDSCLACYVADVGCARDNCKVICGIAPTSASCLSCRVSNGCTAAFFSCSGLPDEVTDTGAAGAGGADTAPAAGAAGT
jgi:hypothetical protein